MMISRSRFAGWCCLGLFVQQGHGFSPSSIRTAAIERIQGRSGISLQAGVSSTDSYLNSLSRSKPNSLSRSKPLAITSKSPTERRIEMLDAGLKGNRQSLSLLFDEIESTRRRNGGKAVDELFNDLLTVVDMEQNVEQASSLVRKQFPWWTRFRFMGRISKRARRASLQRVLNISTPTAEEDRDDADAAKKRRKRSLAILLRSLAKSSSSTEDDDEDEAKNKNKPLTIMDFEKAAKRDAKLQINPKDMSSRLPPGLETPKYSVLVTQPKVGFEIRKYEDFAVCMVPMNQPVPVNASASATDAKLSNPQLAGAGSFGALAGYLFGKNDQSTAMKMTTPVFSNGSDDDRQMSFVMPSEYWKNIDAAPKPLEGSRVQLKKQMGGERAVKMFGGFATKQQVEAQTKELMQIIAKQNEWMTASQEEQVTSAQYNDPFTPPWKRLNEVSVPVVPLMKK
mmetsp:Transcript_1813/g.3223  ORF Transcript_1813/g.3223 Transcript_1813/m.3223 type:complete len:452 (+) Transcript_1813:111-1466(+)